MRSGPFCTLAIKSVWLDCTVTLLVWFLLYQKFATYPQLSFCYLLGGATSIVMLLSLVYFVSDLTSQTTSSLTIVCYGLHLFVVLLTVLLVVNQNEAKPTNFFLVGLFQGPPLLLLKIFYAKTTPKFDSVPEIR